VSRRWIGQDTFAAQAMTAFRASSAKSRYVARLPAVHCQSLNKNKRYNCVFLIII
jgi:hypothetical protein